MSFLIALEKRTSLGRAGCITVSGDRPAHVVDDAASDLMIRGETRSARWWIEWRMNSSGEACELSQWR